MCGICGVVGPTATSARVVRQMLSSIHHRGPDEGGFLVGNELRADEPASSSEGAAHVLLGNRRLRVVDLSAAGRQPMSGSSGRTWLAFNGEIYNFRELRAELENKGHVLHTGTDTEVVLHLYDELGDAMLPKLRGMFAFALWDARRSRVLLARDPLGVKPLYVATVGETLVFASETRCLMASGLVPRTLDAEGVASYLLFGSVQEPLTLFRGVRSLPPGSSLAIEIDPAGGAARSTLATYWSLLDEDAPVTRPEAVSALVHDAVRSQLVSDVPLGAFLSGGVDSGAIVSAMAKAAPGRVRALTLAFAETAWDESIASRATAELVGAQHDLVKISAADAAKDVPSAIAAMDQPTMDGVNTWFVSRAARQDGLTVALSGTGGDEVFAGYATSQRTPALRRLRKMGRSVLALAALASPNRDRRAKLRAMSSEPGALGDPYFVQRQVFTPTQVRALAPGAPVDALLLGPWGQRAVADLEVAAGLDAVTGISYLELRHYMLSTLLRDTDAMSMAHSLEVRVPLLDPPLVRALLGTAGPQKLGNGGKPLLRASAPDVFARDAPQSPKRTFTLPWEAWLRGELRVRVETRLHKLPAPLRGIVAPDAGPRVWRDFLDGATSWSRPWTLFVLFEWVEREFGTEDP